MLRKIGTIGLILAVLLAVPVAVQAQQQHSCTNQKTATANASSAVVVPGVAGTNTLICGIVLSSGTAGATFSIIEGTGTTCGTGTLGIIGDASNLFTTKLGVEVAAWSSTPSYRTMVSGDDVCIKGGVAGVIVISISYLQI